MPFAEFWSSIRRDGIKPIVTPSLTNAVLLDGAQVPAEMPCEFIAATEMNGPPPLKVSKSTTE
jgi:hypothetical protein